MQFIIKVSFILGFFTLIVNAQSGSLSSSPYSTYGLGLSNNGNTGKTNALGKSGIAMPFNHSINSLNPSLYGSIEKDHFLFDVGVKGETETLFETGVKENRTNWNFSSIALAFAFNEKSGIGLTLIPFTNVGYTLLNIETNVEGTTNEVFFTDVIGDGGLNELKLNYGYSITPKFKIGATGSVLFGKINETETSIINNGTLSPTLLTNSDTNYYSGFRLSLGAYYQVNEKIAFGSTINLPTSLKGRTDSSAIQRSYAGFHLWPSCGEPQSSHIREDSG